jgi:hypothetical protein
LTKEKKKKKGYTKMGGTKLVSETKVASYSELINKNKSKKLPF